MPGECCKVEAVSGFRVPLWIVGGTGGKLRIFNSSVEQQRGEGGGHDIK